MSLSDYGFWVLSGAAVLWILAQGFLHPSDFAQILVFGFTQGAIYALVALGYTMVYGIIELINFAHGDVFTLSAYIGTVVLGFFAVTDGSFSATNVVAMLVAFPVVMLVMGGINVAIERVAYRPLRNAPRLAPLITAIGMSFLLENIGAAIWGFTERPLTATGTSIFPANTLFTVGGFPYRTKSLIVVLITVPVLLL